MELVQGVGSEEHPRSLDFKERDAAAADERQRNERPTKPKRPKKGAPLVFVTLNVVRKPAHQTWFWKIFRDVKKIKKARRL